MNSMLCTMNSLASPLRNLSFKGNLIGTEVNSIIRTLVSDRHFHTSMPRSASSFKARDRKELMKTVGKRDDGTEGETLVSLDASMNKKEDMLPDNNTQDRIFNGVPYKMIPICNVRVSKNNTHIRLGDADNKSIVYRSCGAEGFKNCRKGTNVAAQSTALYVCNKARISGVTDIRLKIRGMGPGRMAAIKGLQMGGLNIISITDDTEILFPPRKRPRKPRRI